MPNLEKFNAPGDYQIDPDECNGIRMCARIVPSGASGNLLNTIGYKNREVTIVERQPESDDEKILMMEAAMICPFGAVLYKNNSLHPDIRKHAERVSQDPELVKRARANVFHELARKELRS